MAATHIHTHTEPLTTFELAGAEHLSAVQFGPAEDSCAWTPTVLHGLSTATSLRSPDGAGVTSPPSEPTVFGHSGRLSWRRQLQRVDERAYQCRGDGVVGGLAADLVAQAETDPFPPAELQRDPG